MAEKYKIGEVLVTKADVEIEAALSGKKRKVPKGSHIVIGADRLAHHLNTGIIQPLAADSEVKGYDVIGIARVVMHCLERRYPLIEIFENYDIEYQEFGEEIEFALSEYVGM